jgi:molecular chaperone GrpE (heat shock protein)
MLTPPSEHLDNQVAYDEMKQCLVEYLSQIHDLKRQLADKEQERQDQQKDFLLGQIELLDALERKDANLREKNGKSTEALKIINSYGTVHKRVLQQLSRHGVSRITFPENRLIIGLSKVVETEPDVGKPNDTILAIINHGYMRGNIVLREAELIVVKN